MIKICCPSCWHGVPLDAVAGNCPSCNRELIDEWGVYNLIENQAIKAEQSFYDNTYQSLASRSSEKEDVAGLRDLWFHADKPENEIIFNQVGDLSGKRILLLGNGSSEKELYFLTQGPALVVYTDLSPFASVGIRKRFNLQPYEDILRYAAVDAQNLPFEDEVFDIVYGFAMVHHLPEVEQFLEGVARVLKPGGQAVFLDDAYAPLWHYSKKTFLRPLMKYSHKKTGISPEDLRFSTSGGFKEEELSLHMYGLNVDPWFKRESLLTYVIYRAATKLLPKGALSFLERPNVAKAIVRFDRVLCNLPFLKGNQIRLIWGMTKKA